MFYTIDDFLKSPKDRFDELRDKDVAGTISYFEGQELEKFKQEMHEQQNQNIEKYEKTLSKR